MCNNDMLQRERQHQEQRLQESMQQGVTQIEPGHETMVQQEKEQFVETLVPVQREIDVRTAGLLRRQAAVTEIVPEETAPVQEPAQEQELTKKQQRRLAQQYKSDIKAAAKRNGARMGRQREAVLRRVGGEMPVEFDAFVPLEFDRRNRLLAGQDDKLDRIADMNERFAGSGQADVINEVFDQMLATELRPDMMTSEYMRDHYAEMNNLVRQIDQMNFLMRRHSEVYAQRPLVQQRKLQLLSEQSSLIGNGLMQLTRQYGVDIDGTAVTSWEKKMAVDALNEGELQNRREIYADYRQKYLSAAEETVANAEAEMWPQVRTEMIRRRRDQPGDRPIAGLEDLADQSAVEKITRVRDLIAQRGAEHPEAMPFVDKVYSHMLRCTQAYAWNEIRRETLERLPDEIGNDPETEALLAKRAEELVRRSDVLGREMDLAEQAVSHLLGVTHEGEDVQLFLRKRAGFEDPALVSEEERIVSLTVLLPERFRQGLAAWDPIAAEQGFRTDSNERQRGVVMADLNDVEKNKGIARMYAELKQQKEFEVRKKAWGDPEAFSEEQKKLDGEHETAKRATANFVKELLTPDYTAIMNADIDRYLASLDDPDALLAVLEETTLLQFNSQQGSDLGQNLMHTGGPTVKTAILGDRGEEFVQKSTILQQIARIARYTAMIRAVEMGVLTEGALAEADLRSLGRDAYTAKTPAEMIEKFQQNIRGSESLLATARAKYLQGREEYIRRGRFAAPGGDNAGAPQ